MSQNRTALIVVLVVIILVIIAAGVAIGIYEYERNKGTSASGGSGSSTNGGGSSTNSGGGGSNNAPYTYTFTNTSDLDTSTLNFGVQASSSSYEDDIQSPTPMLSQVTQTITITKGLSLFVPGNSLILYTIITPSEPFLSIIPLPTNLSSTSAITFSGNSGTSNNPSTYSLTIK